MSGGRRELPFASPTQWRFLRFFRFVLAVKADDIKFSKRRGVRNLTQTCDPPHIFPSAQKAEL